MIFVDHIRKALAQREKQVITFHDHPLSPAAVLLPLFNKGGECYILLTKRTETLLYHKGQICFPGGACHESDEGLVQTALRETYEEIGVEPRDVDVLGELDSMGTITSNFLITPYVGIIPYPYEFKVSDDEIESIIEVPVMELLDEKNCREEAYDLEGEILIGNVYDYQGNVIWGATARMLKQFLEIAYPGLDTNSK